MFGLLEVAVNVWVGLLLALPLSGSWNPSCEGTLKLVIGERAAVINWRLSRTSTNGRRRERAPGWTWGPVVCFLARKVPLRIRSHMPDLLALEALNPSSPRLGGSRH